MLTPNAPAFDGVEEGCCEEALFLVKNRDNEQAICEVHLCDCDSMSPSGFCWDYTVYAPTRSGWMDWDGGQYWDYASADAVFDFDLPDGFEDAEIRLADPELSVYDLLDDGRPFTEDEWEAATNPF